MALKTFTMKFEEIRDKIREYQDAGKRIFTSSSFQTHSIVLLHIISRIDKQKQGKDLKAKDITYDY